MEPKQKTGNKSCGWKGRAEKDDRAKKAREVKGKAEVYDCHDKRKEQ